MTEIFNVACMVCFVALSVEGLMESEAKEQAFPSVQQLQAIAELPEAQQAFASGSFSALITEFRRRERTLQGGFALALYDQDLVAGLNAPAGWRELRTLLPSLTLLDRQPARTFTMNNHDYIVGAAKVGVHGRILIVMPLPAQFRQTLDQINASERN